MSTVTHPIPARLKSNPTPHIGPDLDSYKRAHALTTGENREAFWAKVSYFDLAFFEFIFIFYNRR